jgi:hypothetical protein
MSINVNMYSHGRDKISNLMDRFLHEFINNSENSLLQSKYHFTVVGITPKKLLHILLWNGRHRNIGSGVLGAESEPYVHKNAWLELTSNTIQVTTNL